eukprot:240187-Chlamydomonas_euryale.AAC.4
MEAGHGDVHLSSDGPAGGWALLRWLWSMFFSLPCFRAGTSAVRPTWLERTVGSSARSGTLDVTVVEVDAIAPYAPP